MKIKAIIFDFDGVIVDSDAFHKKALVYALKQKGLNFTDDLYQIKLINGQESWINNLIK